MRLKQLYLGLCVIGTVLPYSQFLPFVREHGFDLTLLIHQLFANRISGFFALGWMCASGAHIRRCRFRGRAFRRIARAYPRLGSRAFVYNLQPFRDSCGDSRATGSCGYARGWARACNLLLVELNR